MSMGRVHFLVALSLFTTVPAQAQTTPPPLPPLDPPCAERTPDGTALVSCRTLMRCLDTRRHTLEAARERVVSAFSERFDRVGSAVNGAYNQLVANSADPEVRTLGRVTLAYGRELIRVRMALAAQIHAALPAAAHAVTPEQVSTFLASPTGEAPGLTPAQRRRLVATIRSLPDSHRDGCRSTLDIFSERVRGATAEQARDLRADADVLPEGSLLPCLSRELYTRLSNSLNALYERLERNRVSARGAAAAALRDITMTMTRAPASTAFGRVRTMPNASEPLLRKCQTYTLDEGNAVPEVTLCREVGAISGLQQQVSADQAIVVPAPVPDRGTFLSYHLTALNRAGDCTFTELPESVYIPPIGATVADDSASTAHDAPSFSGVRAARPAMAAPAAGASAH